MRCKQRQKRREMGIPDNRPEMRKRISTRSNVPNPDSLIVASRDEMFPIVRPHNAIASSDMRLASLAGRAFLPNPSSPHTPTESSRSRTPRLPALRRTSQSRTVPSTPPLARMWSSCGLQPTESTAHSWPASEWALAPVRRSTSLMAGCCVAQATSRWLAIGERAWE